MKEGLHVELAYSRTIIPAPTSLLLAAINTLHSSCGPHLNRLNILLWSVLFCYFSFPACFRTSPFLTLSIRDTPTKLFAHSRTFTFLLLELPCLCHKTSQLVQLRLHADTYLYLYLIFYSSAHFSVFK